MKQTLTILFLAFLAWSCDSGKQDELVVIHTRYGDIKVLLYEETPLHKANFLKLVKDKAYDSTNFHRVIQDFMVQGGNIGQRIEEKKLQYNGGKSPLSELAAEIRPGLFHHKGALAAARRHDSQNPQKMSSGDQFYIVKGRTYRRGELDSMEIKVNYERLAPLLGQVLQGGQYPDILQKAVEIQQRGDVNAMIDLVMQQRPLVEKVLGKQDIFSLSETQKNVYATSGGTPFLDGGYTVFGRVVEGLHIVDSISTQPCDRMNTPIEPIYMKLTVEKMDKEAVSKKYGYVYPVAK